MAPINLQKANVDEGILSIYRKPLLSTSLSKQYLMAGDICMVVDDNLSIIINIQASSSDDLLATKQTFDQIYHSFFYGMKKPVIHSVQIKNNNWVMKNQNLARRLHHSKFKLTQEPNLLYKQLADKLNVNRLESYHNKNGAFLWDQEHLVFLTKKPVASIILVLI